MRATFILVALLTLGYAADVHYFNGMYSHAASLMFADITQFD
jgi:hypothetical protein